MRLTERRIELIPPQEVAYLLNYFHNSLIVNSGLIVMNKA